MDLECNVCMENIDDIGSLRGGRHITCPHCGAALTIRATYTTEVVE